MPASHRHRHQRLLQLAVREVALVPARRRADCAVHPPAVQLTNYSCFQCSIIVAMHLDALAPILFSPHPRTIKRLVVNLTDKKKKKDREKNNIHFVDCLLRPGAN